MRSYLGHSALLIVIWLSLTHGSRAADAVWVPFKSDPGRFSIEMPGRPEISERHNTSFLGTITNHIFVAREGHEWYTVDYTDLPAVAVTFASDATIYSHAKNAVLKFTWSKERKFENATLSGLQGKHLFYDAPPVKGHPEMLGQAYFFLVGKRLYVIDAIGPADKNEANFPRFFSSFQVEKKP